MTTIFRVIQQGKSFAVQSQNAEGGKLMKCNIVLQEMGGKYENQFVATMLGQLAVSQLQPGDVVAATLRFTTHQFEDRVFQDCLVTDLYKL